MVKSILFCLIALLIFGTIRAQYSLTGKIRDENNDGIFFATIVLFSLPDSAIAKTSTSDEKGEFRLTEIKKGDYYLEAGFTGFETTRKPGLNFPTDQGTDLIIVLKAKEEELEHIEVIGKKPLLEQESDRLVVNVADNITGGNNNLTDVLKKVPGIIVTGNTISLAGATNITILINGKTTKYMDVESLLRDMPGDNIQKVEIIHQPGAEFDAAGSGPILNIILKKNSLFGTNGTVDLSAERSKVWRTSAGISLSHYSNNLNIQGSLGYRDAKYKEIMTIDRSVVKDYYHQVSNATYAANGLRGNLGFDWDINDRHRVGFQSRFLDHKSLDFTDNVTDINYNDSLITDQIIKTTNAEDGYWRYAGINPYYIFTIDTAGQKLELDLNYFLHRRDGENILTPTDLVTDDVMMRFKYNQPGTTQIFVGGLDYTYPFSKLLKLQIGTKYSLAYLDNNFLSYYEWNTAWQNDTTQSNHYLFNESILAGYSKLSFATEKWSGTLGLRYEDSNSEGRSVGMDTVLNRRVKKFFPSGSVSREITKGVSGSLAYSYRLDRPRYMSLNPFRYLLDSYTSFRGNPDLRPEFTHSMKFSLAYQKQPFFNIEYKLTNDAMVSVVEQNDATGEGFRSTVNIDKRTEFNASLYFPLDFIPGFSGYGGVIASRMHYLSPYLDDIFDKTQWSFTGFLQVGYTLPGDIKAEVSGFYTSGGMQGLINSEWMFSVSFGLSRSFFDNRLKLNIGGNDVLCRFFHGNVKYSNMDMSVLSIWDAPSYTISLSYKFGNRHLKEKEHKSGAVDEINRAKED